MLMIPSALALVCLVGGSVWAHAATSTLSGQMTFEFLADDKRYYDSFQDITESDQFEATSATCTVSIPNNDDEEKARVTIQCVFDLQDEADGRIAALDLKLDLGQIPADGSKLPTEAMEIHYQENVGERILYQGTVADARIWIVAADPTHEFVADIAIIFHDHNKMAGSRVLIRGQLTTKAQTTHRQPEPRGYHDQTWCYEECERRCYQQCDQTCNINDLTCQTYCHSDCRIDCANQCLSQKPEPSHDPVWEEEAGCGGTEADTSGCGEVWVDSCDVMLDCSASTYPEDDYDDPGCESSDTAWEDDSGCEGDTTDSQSCESEDPPDCEGDAYAATKHKQHIRAAPIRALLRFFPELVAFAFIHSWRRRHRRD